MSDSHRKLYHWRKKKGICTKCGSNDIAPDLASLCGECAALMRERQNRKNARTKQRLIEGYGGQCRCCGETEALFLTIDHVNEDGAHERRTSQTMTHGYSFYRRLIKNGFPETYQILCWNCNSGKHLNDGVCPHTQQQEDTHAS